MKSHNYVIQCNLKIGIGLKDRTKSGQNALVCRLKAPDTIATEVSKLLLPMLARMTGWNASGLNTEQAHLLTQPRGQA